MFRKCPYYVKTWTEMNCLVQVSASKQFVIPVCVLVSQKIGVKHSGPNFSVTHLGPICIAR